ncbi:hypothetical protein SAMN05216376_102118 [Mameliella alba]|uniref:hypothetical protein n=1 Tax=Mameliella alba TaxID=561184 RepID=UPI000889FA58|nr:hypothetical protein [Mameliella alba]OWV49730.1 hypothetical protein CDZ96_04970 [Mameliella alba]PTR41720.1 hypothetical protein LX94_01012 [Mameliella alba]GGF53874.1 hypothetical protein GCM10011319_14150 [Mameliella alba]SDC32910.1 hypothetical protein SAMN05216376_102118 [Mameliella alba]
MSFARLSLVAILASALSGPAAALNECDFSFDLDRESSAMPSIRRKAEELRGFWRPIKEAPDDVQQLAKFVGRFDICLVTPDGKPRTIRRGRRIFPTRGLTKPLRNTLGPPIPAIRLPGTTWV